MSELTLGELMDGRKLHKQIINGEKRYKPGQTKARKFTKTDAVVSYVDTWGVLCQVPVMFVDDEWVARRAVIRYTPEVAEVRNAPHVTKVHSPEVLSVLAAKPRPPVDQTT